MPKNPAVFRDNGVSHQNRITQREQEPAPARGRPPRPGSSFAARFGRVILQHGIAAIPSALYHYQGQLELSAQQVWFVSYVLAHKWDEDLPYPSLKKMARCTLLSLSQLQRIKNTLCEMDYLKVLPRFGDKQAQQTNAYDFSGLFECMERLIVADSPQLNEIRAEGSAPDITEIAEADPSFIARYGRVIVRHGVAAVPRALYTHQSDLRLTPQQVWFVTYIFSFQWDTVLPYPSLRRMATITGYSRVQLHNIKSELVDMGHLTLIHRSNELGGQDTNAYDFSGLLENIRALLQPEKPPSPEAKPTIEIPSTKLLPKRRGRRATPSNTDNKGTRVQLSGEGRAGLPDRDSTGLSDGGRIELAGGDSVQLPVPNSARLTRGDRSRLPAEGRRELSGGTRSHLAGADSAPLAEPDKPKASGGTPRSYRRGIARVLHEEEAFNIETNKEDDSNHISRKIKFETKNTDASEALPFSPYIAAVITDFSTELNDPSHVISNVTQALRLWKLSEIDEQAFVELLHEVKRRTRQSQGKQGVGGLNNKMAYFFTLVRELSRPR